MTGTPFREPILHVDMDAFFVEVERLYDPALRNLPVVVGGAGNRGVVAAASYEARRFGVQSAMPMVEARRCCPAAVVVTPDHGRYREASVEVFAVLRSVTPLVEGLSVDEAFLDISGLRLHYDSPLEVAEHIRHTLRSAVGLPSSVGVAANKFLAKLASEKGKPDGVHQIPAGEELAFLHPLDVRALWGVGEATRAALERLGVRTVGELAALPEDLLKRHLGQTNGAHLHELAHGRDSRRVTPDVEAKSLSVEQTYESDLVGWEVVETEVLRHSDRLSWRLRRSGLAGRTLTVKVRFSDFSTVTRSSTLLTFTDHAREINAIARRLVSQVVDGSRPVRLLGVGLSGLVAAGGPRQLEVDRPAKWDDLEDAVDGIRRRFGAEAVGPARLVEGRGAGPDRAVHDRRPS